MDTPVPASQKFALAADKVKSVLGCIRRRVASRSRKVILRLCSAPVESHLEHWAQLWAPQYQRHVDPGEGPAKGH